jgi:outer membrane protein TolC
MKKIFLLFLMILPSGAKSQTVFSFEEYKNQVLRYHPTAINAGLNVKVKETQVLQARAAFDPNIILENSQKTLNDKNYFNYTLSEVIYQSPFAAKLKAGYEFSNGSFINPENTNGTLGFMGIEIPILKGLLTDYKRTTLAQSKLILKQSEQERLATLNDLIYEAYLAYFSWAYHYKMLIIAEEFKQNAAQRLNLMKIAYNQGDRAQADTVEAAIQYDRLRLNWVQIQLDYAKSQFELSNFLWNENNNPYLISSTLLPDINALGLIKIENLSQLLTENLKQSNPDLNYYFLKEDILKTNSKLYKQEFLPELNLKANLLNQSNLSPDVVFAQPVNENYKFGFNFTMPLFFREARSKNLEVKIKLRENEMLIKNKTWDLENKIKSLGIEVENLNQQLGIYTSLDKNYRAMLKNENIKFKEGDSSLFFINSREISVLENASKLYQIELKLLDKSSLQQKIAGTLVNL